MVKAGPLTQALLDNDTAVLDQYGSKLSTATLGELDGLAGTLGRCTPLYFCVYVGLPRALNSLLTRYAVELTENTIVTGTLLGTTLLHHDCGEITHLILGSIQPTRESLLKDLWYLDSLPLSDQCHVIRALQVLIPIYPQVFFSCHNLPTLNHHPPHFATRNNVSAYLQHVYLGVHLLYSNRLVGSDVIQSILTE